MRRPEMMPPDPDVQAELDAIDATLRGEAVDPVYAELAEVALLVAGERPAPPRDEFVQALDVRVQQQFKPQPRSEVGAESSGASFAPRHRTVALRRPSVLAAFGAVVAACAATAIVLPNLPSTNTLNGSVSGVVKQSSGSGGASSGTQKSPSSAASSSGSAGAAKSAAPLGARSTHRSEFGAASSSSSTASAPAQASSGRKIEQSTQIELSTRNGRIDTVSQELFNVASAENAIVERSHVNSTAAGGSFANFTLSVPDNNLQSTMDRLSLLHYANVVSRQQSSQDVTDQYNDDKRALADAQALRTSLLKQLQSAYTTTAIDSLKAQIQTVEGRIRSDENALNKLAHATSYTTVSVQINSQNAPVAVTKSSSGFSVGRGAHDALRVLVVVAGVALIVLAALIPIGLVAALLLWTAYWIRQRRRERALDQP